jgi:RNase P subunit RPR2
MNLFSETAVSAFGKGVSYQMMYCVKCRAKREGKDAQTVTMKNGKMATKAVCEVCGTTMFKIGGK